MPRTVLLIAIGIALCAASYADETPVEKTTLKIYPVGDLVSLAAINNGMGGTTSMEAWASEYPETIKALDELQGLVETMIEPKPRAVNVYAPSLSLIVRHTETGHQEVDQLLRSLSQGNTFSIRMNCTPLYGESTSEVLTEELSDEDDGRLGSLLTKPHMTKSETIELMSLLPSRPEYDAFKESVLLKSGHRTSWGPKYRPCTAMGRVNRASNSVQLRIDHIADDYAEATPFGLHVFTLAEGESALFQQYCDGGLTVWLVTAEIIIDEPARFSSR